MVLLECGHLTWAHFGRAFHEFWPHRGGDRVRPGGRGVSSPMLAPPSFRSFLSPVVPDGGDGGRSGCGHACNCSSRSEEITVWVRCRFASLPIVTSRTVERCAEHSTTQSCRRARSIRCVPARRSTKVAVIDAWLVADEDASAQTAPHCAAGLAAPRCRAPGHMLGGHDVAVRGPAPYRTRATPA